MEFPYVERTIVQINKTVLMITSPNMAIRCSMIGSTKHTSLRVTDRIDDPPKQASEIVISPYNIEYISMLGRNVNATTAEMNPDCWF
jgi:hypothetical protein